MARGTHQARSGVTRSVATANVVSAMIGDTRRAVSFVKADEQDCRPPRRDRLKQARSAPPESARACATWPARWPGQRAKTAEIAALVGQQGGVAAVRLDEGEPRPVDDRRNECREEAPAPGGAPPFWSAIGPG